MELEPPAQPRSSIVPRPLDDVPDCERSEDQEKRADAGDVCGGCHIIGISRPKPSPLCPRLRPGPAEIECHRPARAMYLCSASSRIPIRCNPHPMTPDTDRWQSGPRHRVRMNGPHSQVVGVMSVPGKVSREEPLSLALEPAAEFLALERLLLAESPVRQPLTEPPSERARRHRLPVRPGEFAKVSSGGVSVERAHQTTSTPDCVAKTQMAAATLPARMRPRTISHRTTRSGRFTLPPLLWRWRRGLSGTQARVMGGSRPTSKTRHHSNNRPRGPTPPTPPEAPGRMPSMWR